MYGALAVLQGEVPERSLEMLRHGLAWVLLAVAIDDLTSWLMMSLLGPNAEGNLAQRLFFESPTLASFANEVYNQWPWIIIIALACLAITLIRVRESYSGATRQVLSAACQSTCAAAIMMSWVPALYRIAVGAGSNVAGILTRFGPTAPSIGWDAISLAVALSMSVDVVRILFYD